MYIVSLKENRRHIKTLKNIHELCLIDRLNVESDVHGILSEVSAEQNHIAEITLPNACMLLRIDNILLFAELSADQNAIYIDNDAIATDNTFMRMWESTVAATARRNELTAEEKWWNLRSQDNYNYDKWSHQLTNVEDVTISSIERL